MSQINVNNIYNRTGDAGPVITGPSTVAGALNVTGALTVNGLITGDGSGITNLPGPGAAQTAKITTESLVVLGVTTVGVITSASSIQVTDVYATTLYGDGSNLTGLANTDFIVSAATTTGSLNVTGDTVLQGDLVVNGENTFINAGKLDLRDINIGLANTTPRLTNSELDGAGITIYGLNSNKTLTYSNSNNRMEFSDAIYAPVIYGDGSGITGVTPDPDSVSNKAVMYAMNQVFN